MRIPAQDVSAQRPIAVKKSEKNSTSRLSHERCHIFERAPRISQPPEMEDGDVECEDGDGKQGDAYDIQAQGQ